MPKNKEKAKVEADEEVKEKVAEEGKEEGVVVAEESSEKSVAKGKFPEVAGTGRFQSVQFKGGYVVYNPAGQRVSDVLSLSQAEDIVRAQNQAAHIKVPGPSKR